MTVTPINPVPKPKDDFDIKDLVNTVDGHATNISDVSKRLKTLEEKLGSPLQLAGSIVECSEQAVKMQEMMEKTFLNLLSKNEPIKNEVRKMIEAVDRGFFNTQLRKYGNWVVGSILFVLVQFGIEVIKLLSKKIFGNSP